jgi:hypothetical protein
MATGVPNVAINAVRKDYCHRLILLCDREIQLHAIGERVVSQGCGLIDRRTFSLTSKEGRT